MILKSIQDCEQYTPSFIDYSSIEVAQRERNVEEFYKYLQFRNISYLHSLLLQKYNPNYNDLYPHDLVRWYALYSQKTNLDYTSKIKETLKWYSKYNKEFNIKLSNYCTQWDLEKNYVLHKLNISPDFVNNFIKDPSRQTLHQHFAAQWISENIPFIENFRELPAGGENAYYIDSNGDVICGKGKKITNTEKSIDFVWEYNLKIMNVNKKIVFYATHKHTKIHGGSQDNQLHDVFDFHKHARNCTNPNIFFFSITDGQYYQDRYTKEKNCDVNAIEFMKKNLCGSRNNASYTNRLLLDILDVITEWINYSFEEYLNNEEIKLEFKKRDIIRNKYMQFLNMQ